MRLHGFDCIDLNLAEVCNTPINIYMKTPEEFERILKDVKAAADKEGIEIYQCHGPWRHPPKDATEEDRAEWKAYMERGMYGNYILGCKYFVIHPIMPFGIEDVKIGKQQETRDLNIAFFTELVAFAKQYGVTICLENMPMRHFSMATPEQILEFVERFHEENFKICLDTGHVAVFPNLSIGDEVRRLGDYIKVLHIHDNMGNRDAHLYPGRGILDWPGFVRALEDIGFDGVLSLEIVLLESLDDDAFDKESAGVCKQFKELVTQGMVP
jgi:sugar phosphate isomerase/epimerase